MNSHQFIQVIQNADQLGKEDISQLVKMHEAFPYFSIPKALLACHEFQKSGGESKEFLHWAAVTCPNRSWLKLMVESDSPLRFLKNKLLENYKGPSSRIDHNYQTIDLDDFEKSLVPEPQQEPDPEERAKTLKELGESLKQNMRKFTDTSQVSKKPIEKEKKKEGKKEKAPKVRSADELLENIKKKEKKEIQDGKMKEQIDLIKAFSKKEIKLATLKEIEDFQKQTDLSEKSTQLNPTLLSETFAKLLVKQGKKQRAKEIYKKLMVKFPEKSVYFADLIKELD